MTFTELAWNIFNQSIANYHIHDDVNTEIQNPYSEKEIIEHLLYQKNWIDTVQWHYEDIIRDENINPVEALVLKRKIDASNQKRTDLVEYIDSWFLEQYKHVQVQNYAKVNTESPAWAIDRLSILALKIYHMEEETTRENATEEHKIKCLVKLQILLSQHQDLTTAIEELLEEFKNGTKYMKVYKQMKMYNDKELNPILYKK